MTDQPNPDGFILVSLDTLRGDVGALERLAEIAALLQRRLHGLYIEDEDLLTIAGLPFTREINLHTRDESNLERNQLEQQMRAMARQAEAMLAQSAERWGVEWQFQQVRGKVTAELAKAAERAGLVSLLASSQNSYLNRLLPQEQDDLRRLLQLSCILLPAVITAGEEVVVVIDSSDQTESLLQPAQLICANRPVTILLSGGDTPLLRQQLEQECSQRGISAAIFDTPMVSLGQLETLLERRKPNLIIMHQRNDLLAAQLPEKWVQRMQVPMLLVQQPAAAVA
ncbi:MAG TPA: hypothetical protein DCF45_01620 [Gammaproteobacteria bacterium]|nr:hypothetical protein [Gammaproteobacteria bacterium]